MKPRIAVFTLGANNLENSLKFYRDGFGLETQGIVGEEFEYGAVAFFEFQNGLKFALYPRKSLAHDANIPQTSPSPTEFSI